MSRTHPSDEVLQQYVLEQAGCPAEEIMHIESCPECQSAIAAYKALTNELARQPAPAFDFDLAAAVIGQLEEVPAPTAKTPALTIVLIAAFIAIPLWLFRKSAYFVFTDMSAVFYRLVFAVGGIVVGVFLFRLYKKYQQIINLIK